MKRNTHYILLIVAAVCSCMLAASSANSNFLLTLLSFPFAQIGAGLAKLSLSGTVGNVCAWVIYLALGLSPLLLLLRKPITAKAKAVSVGFSVVLLYVLYHMINPYSHPMLTATPMGTALYKAQFGALVYVLLVCCLVLRWLKRLHTTDAAGLYRSLIRLLQVFSVLLVIGAFGGCTSEILSKLAELTQNNTNTANLMPTKVMLVLGSLVSVLPLLLNTATAMLAIDLLSGLSADSPHVAELAHRLSKWCAAALGVSMIALTVFHVVQILLLPQLRTINSTVNVPIVSMVFVLVCLVLARLIEENRSLKDEQDLFI